MEVEKQNIGVITNCWQKIPFLFRTFVTTYRFYTYRYILSHIVIEFLAWWYAFKMKLQQKNCHIMYNATKTFWTQSRLLMHIRCKSACTPSGVYTLMHRWNSFASKCNYDIFESWFSHVENDRTLPREGFLFWSQILSCNFKKIHFSSTNVMAIFLT